MEPVKTTGDSTKTTVKKMNKKNKAKKVQMVCFRKVQ